jgi:hypothetical protein
VSVISSSQACKRQKNPKSDDYFWIRILRRHFSRSKHKWPTREEIREIREQEVQAAQAAQAVRVRVATQITLVQEVPALQALGVAGVQGVEQTALKGIGIPEKDKEADRILEVEEGEVEVGIEDLQFLITKMNSFSLSVSMNSSNFSMSKLNFD